MFKLTNLKVLYFKEYKQYLQILLILLIILVLIFIFPQNKLTLLTMVYSFLFTYYILDGLKLSDIEIIKKKTSISIIIVINNNNNIIFNNRYFQLF
jgi:hypothetical protein